MNLFEIDRLLDKVPWERKPAVWSAAGKIVTDAQVLRIAAKLPTYPAAPSPMTSVADRPRFHVVTLREGIRYLVNTEGYDYARYVARLPEVAR